MPGLPRWKKAVRESKIRLSRRIFSLPLALFAPPIGGQGILFIGKIES
jgi:hypothetical protein